VYTASTQAQLPGLERLVMPGPVVESHAVNEDECASCHVNFSPESQVQLCLDCHLEIAEDLQTNTGFHSLSPEMAGIECAECHTDHEGRDADIVNLDQDAFDHDLTDFPLQGSHLEIVCEDCHAADLTFHDVQSDCNSCHAEDDQHLGNLGETCVDCHTEAGWAEVSFDHETVVGYELNGGHVGIVCVSCHVDELYVDTPNECVGCHVEDDSHLGTNGTECQGCHATQNWTENFFDHFARSEFGLFDGHSGLLCEDCHEGNKLEQETPTTCYGCHMEDDGHDGFNGTECEACHQVTEWLDTTFDHARDAEFPLNGAHAEITCESCHIEPVATALPLTGCFDCHEEDDPHEDQLGADCGSCHGEVLWTESVRFDHDLTVFPLLGRHDEVICEDCHETPAFLDAPEQCVDCHIEDDVHESRFDSGCAQCHNPAGWFFWSFDHAVETRFILDGAHGNLDCHACHREPANGVTALPMTCSSCHRSDDTHRGEFGNNCAQCHTTQSFQDSRLLQ